MMMSIIKKVDHLISLIQSISVTIWIKQSKKQGDFFRAQQSSVHIWRGSSVAQLSSGLTDAGKDASTWNKLALT